MVREVSIEEINNNVYKFKNSDVDLGTVLCKSLTVDEEDKQKGYLRDKEGNDIFFLNHCNEKTQNPKLQTAEEYKIWRCEVKKMKDDDPLILFRSYTKVQKTR